MKKLVLLFWILLGVQTAFSQKILFKGLLLDANGNPVRNARMLVQNADPRVFNVGMYGEFDFWSSSRTVQILDIILNEVPYKDAGYELKTQYFDKTTPNLKLKSGEMGLIVTLSKTEKKGFVLTAIVEGGAKTAKNTLEIVGQKTVKSDSKGYFKIELPENFKTTQAQYKLNGVLLDKNELVFSQNNTYLSIRKKDQQAEFYLIKGKVLPNGLNKIEDIHLRADWNEKQIDIQTKKDGSFEFRVEAGSEVDFKFLVNSFVVEPKSIQVSDAKGQIFISFPMPKIYQYVFVFQDEKGSILPKIAVKINGIAYQTDEKGRIGIETDKKITIDKTIFAFQDYEYVGSLDEVISLRKIKVQEENPQKTETLPTAPMQETVKKQEYSSENSPIQTLNSDTSSHKTTVSNEFNVDHIIGALEMEKQELTARRFKIEQDIRNIESLLRKGQLSEQETNFLKKELQRLENALIENHIAYENAQNQTRNLIDSVKNVVYQRGVLEQKLEQVQRLAMQQAIIFSVIAVLLGALLWIFFMSKRRSQEQNKKLKEANRLIEEKNTVLNVQKEEISAQAESLKDANKIILEKQEVLEKQSHEINQKNESIIASINYASRIQGALLPTLSAIKEHLPQIFVLYKPRDIVSGDFYWFFEKNDKMVLTAADCTGHGVPGALMSMIGMEQLNEIINIHQIFSPNEILTKLDEGIKKHLKQSENQIRDGMDIAMILLDKNKNEVIFSGAKNPLYYVHQNQNPEIVELKATIKAIGGRETRQDVFFEAKTIALEPNQETMFYLMSDGYEDQFGGEKDKKFMKKNLRELLLAIHHKPVEEQYEILDQTIEKWKNGREQTDDILIIGLRWKGRDYLQN